MVTAPWSAAANAAAERLRARLARDARIARENRERIARENRERMALHPSTMRNADDEQPPCERRCEGAVVGLLALVALLLAAEFAFTYAAPAPAARAPAARAPAAPATPRKARRPAARVAGSSAPVYCHPYFSDEILRSRRVAAELFKRGRFPRCDKRACVDERDASAAEGCGSAPTFLVVGAQKAGSTFLFDALAETGRVALPRCKELNYFTRRPARLWSLDEYRCLFRKSGVAGSSGSVAGEASVDYMDLEGDAVRNISKVLAGRRTKIVALLRDPVDRAVSQFVGRVTQVRRGEASMSCDDFFGQGFAAKFGPVAPIARSDYAPRLRRWVTAFGRENVLIVQAETLLANATYALGRVRSFLGLEGRAAPPPARATSRASHHLASADPAEVAARESCDRAAIRRALRPAVRDLRHFLGSELPTANVVALRPWYYAVAMA